MSRTENETIFSAVEIPNGLGNIPDDQSFSGTDISRLAKFVTSLIPISFLVGLSQRLLIAKEN
jgi:hypothetical protein